MALLSFMWAHHCCSDSQAAEAESVPIRKKSKGMLKRRPSSTHISSKNELAPVPSKKFWKRHRRVASDTPSFEYIPVANEQEQVERTPTNHNLTPPPKHHSPAPNSPDHPLMAALVCKSHEMLPERVTPPMKPPRVLKREKIKDEPDGPSLRVDLRRSCSLDALNEIGGDPKPCSQSTRRVSFEVSA